jgi:O-antigen/teichoic acid export membrane protein
LIELRRRAVFTRIAVLPGIWIRGAGYSLIIGAASVINSSADLVMLGAMTNAEETGAYGLAVRVTAILLIPMLAVASGLSHEVSMLHNSGRSQALSDVVRTAGRSVVWLTGSLALLITASTPFFGWMFGAEFVAAIAPLLILCWARFLETLAGQPNMVLVNTSFAGLGAVYVSISAIANIGLNALLIPRFGAVGAAVATAISQLALTAAMAVEVRRKLAVSTLPLTVRRGGGPETGGQP